MGVRQPTHPPADWDDATRVIDQAGRNLVAQYRGHPIPAWAIAAEIQRLSEYGPNSVLPSDYCYNRLNRASFAGRRPLFEHVDRGLYRYLGPHYAYTGPIYWRPRGGREREVGAWENGKCILYDDPR